MLPPTRTAATRCVLAHRGTKGLRTTVLSAATAGMATARDQETPDPQVHVKKTRLLSRHAFTPRSQRELVGLPRENLPPSSPARFWPKYEIPSAATQLECDFPALSGGPVTVGWTSEWLFVQDKTTDDGRRVLKPTTIRDNCSCPQCRDADSGQKTFNSTQIPLDLAISDVRATEEGIVVTFSKDLETIPSPSPSSSSSSSSSEGGHSTLIPWSSIELSLKRKTMEDATLPRKRSLLRRTGLVLWDREVLGRELRRFSYSDFMSPESDAMWHVITDLLRLGIVFLKDVPASPDAITTIVSRIAPLRETFYGRTFDVRAKPNADNVAYTSSHLNLHQDLLYLDPPPMIQALHYLDNTCAGGDSLFSDGERVARLLLPFLRCPSIAPLSDHYIPYHYVKHGRSYFASRHVIETNPGGFAAVHWSPQFQGQYLSPTKDLAPWIRPARLFESLINHEDAVFRLKVEQGDCVLFDNLRLMHGRTAFDTPNSDHPEGAAPSRWLRGAYIAAEDFLSTAAHIPAGLAESMRGPDEWSPATAQRQLRHSHWNKQVVAGVSHIDPNYAQYLRPRREASAARLPWIE